MSRRTVLAAVAATALLAAGAVVAVNSIDSGRVLPGVSVSSLALGGLTEAEAAQRLAEAGGEMAGTVTVRLPSSVEVVAAGDLGWRVDAEATARQAMAAGRSGVLGGIARRLAPGSTLSLEPVVKVDEAVLRASLERLGASLARPAEDARVVFGGGKYGIRLDRPGQRADVEPAVRRYLANPDTTELALQRAPVQATVTAAQLERVVAEGNSLMRPLKLVYLAPAVVKGTQVAFSQTLSPTQVADLYFVRPDGIDLDEVTLERAAARLAAAFDRTPRDARYRVTGPQPEDIQALPSRAGWAIDQKLAAEAIGKAVLDRKLGSVQVAAAARQPAVKAEDLPDPAGLQVIAESTTTYKGSSLSRATNVEVAAARLDGAVIAPGQVFSFNQAIGNIGLENGFKAALVISGGRTVEGVGGGVCQVSTTAFRAFYKAGFPVVERNQHAYRVRWYDPEIGFDAAVYQPYLDLRVSNDLPQSVVVRSFIDRARGTVTVRVYGTPVRRTVVVSRAAILSHTPHPAPRYEVNRSLRPGQRLQVDWAADGYRIRITRKVFTPDGQVRVDDLHTNYRPWQAVYQVGPSRAD
ncbi:MAG TPA: VanW family protein [Deinococcales bacterium]|nr:VanW family protein [Deinococcales bacterium]